MANFGWQTVRTWSGSGQTFQFQSLFHYDSVTRVNNTVTVNNVNTAFRVNRTAGNWTQISGFNVNVRTEVPRGWLRQDTRVRNSSDFTSNLQEYWGKAGNYSFNVSASDTKREINHGLWTGSDNWANGHHITFPALGSPSHSVAVSSKTNNSITVNATMSNWGACATAGTFVSQIAGNSSFTNLSQITAGSGVVHSGLSPNKTYYIRTHATNGGGLSTYSSVISQATLATATQTSVNAQATTATVNATATQGAFATNTYVRYRKQGSSTWSETTKKTGGSVSLSLTGLLPNTTYEYRLAVQTTAGTWFGDIATLKTLPACMIVRPNGSVVNAVPYIIRNGQLIPVNVEKK